MKIVINRCYGGFGLSKDAMMRYAELKGMTLYHEREFQCDHYYKIPVDEYKRLYEEAQKTRSYGEINGLYFSDRDIERNDPLLVQVVEELGHLAWGDHAELKVVEIPDSVRWEINEYDGMERVEEIHRSWV